MSKPQNAAYTLNKVYVAVKEAKAKEIQVGDWFMNKNTYSVYKAGDNYLEVNTDSFAKLPPELKDGLNEFAIGLNTTGEQNE